MYSVRNASRQGLEAILKSGRGYTHKWLNPGDSIVVPGSAISTTIKELSRRNLFSIKEYNRK